ncbi:type IV toxin-antitoxin system AbiEi family antitoxin domain-containing protein [Roseivirga seohaensis]|uniref:type IV toxin-antitoxin system AbiEi family antitoxin domain-containing protein n=1 Tax=Roseivirga seohaensis TaxID=1914963 RepID=UPI003BAD922F
MSTGIATKINQLLRNQPRGTVLLSSWLVDKGYSFNLQRRYRESQWLEPIASGAMIFKGDKVDLSGALYTLQKQLGQSIHFGGKTALSMLGKSHFLELSSKRSILFGNKDEKLPNWFKNHDWGVKIEYHSSSFLESKFGLVDFNVKEFTIKISSPARALMECLYLSSNNEDFTECYELFEPLNNLRPKQVQELLESCTSVKVKRLFLYMAEKAKHSWFEYLNLEKIDLGHGKRSLVENGAYVSKYKITVPKALESNGGSTL